MNLSKKTEYALRSLAAMGRARAGTTFSIQDISKNERIPAKYLEQILVVLKNGGILRSKRGVGGGYQLVSAPARITLGEVIGMIDGDFEPIPCSGKAVTARSACECGVIGGCGLGRTLAALRNTVAEWMSTTTIADIIAADRSRETVSFDI